LQNKLSYFYKSKQYAQQIYLYDDHETNSDTE